MLGLRATRPFHGLGFCQPRLDTDRKRELFIHSESTRSSEPPLAGPASIHLMLGSSGFMLAIICGRDQCYTVQPSDSGRLSTPHSHTHTHTLAPDIDFSRKPTQQGKRWVHFSTEVSLCWECAAH